jgi:hypothetical protein
MMQGTVYGAQNGKKDQIFFDAMEGDEVFPRRLHWLQAKIIGWLSSPPPQTPRQPCSHEHD